MCHPRNIVVSIRIFLTEKELEESLPHASEGTAAASQINSFTSDENMKPRDGKSADAMFAVNGVQKRPIGVDEVYASLLQKEEEFFQGLIERNEREGRQGTSRQEGV